MNINVRIRRYHQSRKAVTIPSWGELQKLDQDEVNQLAQRLGIEVTDRMATLSAIHKSRGSDDQ